MKRNFALSAAFVAASILSGCVTASEHAKDVNQATSEGDKLTVGTVQREIHVGMSGADVAAALGSPNIVTTDEKRREVWVYDKISTNRVYSTSKGGISTLILGGALVGSGLVGGGGGASYGAAAGAEATQQRTLTIIIKFDENKTVRDFAYHTSRF